MVDLKAFGRALTGFRLAAGFRTQEAAAAATGIERTRLVKHENGTGGAPQRGTLRRYEEGYRLAPGTLLAILDGASPKTHDVSDNVPRDTYAGADAEPLPHQLRLRENEVERELIELGATEDEVRAFRRSVRESPLLAALFRGGAPTSLTNEQMLQLFDGVAIGFKAIVEQLVRERRGRGRQ